MWDDRFERVLNENVADPAPLLRDPDASFRSAAVDSMTLVGIVAELEAAYETLIPDECLTAANFRSPRALWQMLVELGVAGPGREGDRQAP